MSPAALLTSCNCCGAIVDDAEFEARGGYCEDCDGDRMEPRQAAGAGAD